MQSLTHEIHFWIGKDSTPDKAGTAAYRTVDLYRHVSQNQHDNSALSYPNDLMSTITTTSHTVVVFGVMCQLRYYLYSSWERLLGLSLKYIAC